MFLWINHGCEIGTLYGDDGEMQCSSCIVDFKRLPMNDLVEHTIKHMEEKNKERLDLWDSKQKYSET